jgi:flagellar hook-length control protein FliK
LDLPASPQSAAVSPPGASNAHAAGALDADQPETAFADLLAAGLSGAARDAALPPPGTPSAEKAAGLLPDADKPDALPSAAGDPAAVLLLAAFGPVPIAIAAPVATAPVMDPPQDDDTQRAPLPPAGDRWGTFMPPPAFGEAVGPRIGMVVPGDLADAARGPFGAAHDLPDGGAADAFLGVNPAMTDTRPAASTAPHAPATAELRTPVNISGWDAELGKTLVWMAQGKHALAELKLNPPELGPLSIVIALGGDDGRDARVAFASPHAAVRDALEAAMPRLREMMADSGINLGQTAVSAESFQRPEHPERFRSPGAPAGVPGAGDAGPHPGHGASALRAQIGIVDIFA